ncbi:MAG: serpin family protein, partial [Tissierellia bacterium]|nr:serpin family protein [Tissierellia bacterium]
MKKSFLIIILLLSLVLSACTASISKDSLNLMDDIQGSNLSPIDISKSNKQVLNKKEAIMDFSLKLFNENFEGENILISPLSIVSALGMVTNGAKDNTLSEMEEVLNSDIQGLNDYLKAYSSYLPSDEAYKVSLANSIWFKDE